MSNYSERRQRGTALLESMLGVAILAFMGAGTAQIAARIAVGQRELRVEGIALAQMRQMLVAGGSTLCGAGTRTIELPDLGSITVESDDCVADPPKITVEPSLHDPALPATLEVEAIAPLRMRVRMSDVGIRSGSGDTEIEVGTRS